MEVIVAREFKEEGSSKLRRDNCHIGVWLSTSALLVQKFERPIRAISPVQGASG